MIKLPKEIRSYKNFHHVNNKLKESNKYASEVNSKTYLLDIMLDNLTQNQQEFIKPIRHLLSKGQGFVCSTGKEAQTIYENGYLCVDVNIDLLGGVVSTKDNIATGSIQYDGVSLFTTIYQNPKSHKTKIEFKDSYWIPRVEFTLIFDVEKDTIESTFPDAFNPFNPTEEEKVMFQLQHNTELTLDNYSTVNYEKQVKSLLYSGTGVTADTFKTTATQWATHFYGNFIK